MPVLGLLLYMLPMESRDACFLFMHGSHLLLLSAVMWFLKQLGTMEKLPLNKYSLGDISRGSRQGITRSISGKPSLCALTTSKICAVTE